MKSVSSVLSEKLIKEYEILKQVIIENPLRLHDIAHDKYCDGTQCSKCEFFTNEKCYKYSHSLTYDICIIHQFPGKPMINIENLNCICNDIALDILAVFAIEKCLKETDLSHREIYYTYRCEDKIKVIEGLIDYGVYDVSLLTVNSVSSLLYQLATILHHLKEIKYSHGNNTLSSLKYIDKSFKHKTDRKTHKGPFKLVLFDLKGCSFEINGKRFISNGEYYKISDIVKTKKRQKDTFELSQNDIDSKHKYYNPNSHCIDFVLFFKHIMKINEYANVIYSDRTLNNIHDLTMSEEIQSSLLDIVIGRILNK